MKTFFKIILLLAISTTFLLTFSSCGGDDDPVTPPSNPIINNITPTNGPKTTIVEINGQDFGTDASIISVFFNEVSGTVQSVTDTKIVAIVPPRAYTGNVKVIKGTQEIVGPIFTYTIIEIQSSDFVGSGMSGTLDGTTSSAEFNRPEGMAFDSQGNLFVADFQNSLIRKITPSGVVSTFAGSTFGTANGTGTAAQFGNPIAIAIDTNDNLFVLDFGNNNIRKITPSGVVSNFVGAVDASSGDVDGTGVNARFNLPFGIVLTSNGELYIADYFNNKIRKVTPAGVVSTLAGSGTSGNVDGTGTAALFSYPSSIAIDNNGDLFISEEGNNQIRKVTPAGVATVFVGSGTSGNVNGTGTAASFAQPEQIDFDPDGNLYVIEWGNHQVRKITPAGVVTTFAGNGTQGDAIGIATATRFRKPIGLVVADDYTVYIADTDNHKIKKITQE